MSPESAEFHLLDTLVDAVLRDEDWRTVVDGPLDSEVARLASVAESIHDAAKRTQPPTTRQRLPAWDRLFRRRVAHNDGRSPSAPGQPPILPISGDRPLLPPWRSGRVNTLSLHFCAQGGANGNAC